MSEENYPEKSTMKNRVKIFIRTVFRYLYFRMVRLFDIVLNIHKPFSPLESINTILFVEVQDIGDTIIATPCIRQIRKRFPNATIHMLVQNKSLDMVRYNPNLRSSVWSGSYYFLRSTFSCLHGISKKRLRLGYQLKPERA